MAYGFLNYYQRVATAKEYVTDIEKSVEAYKGYMINRLNRMFKYVGLPDTLPAEILEFYLITNGSCFVTKVKGELYALKGSFGGEPDPYYRPSLYVVANPALNLSKEYKLWNNKGIMSDEGVFMRNDVLWQGLNPLLSRYAYLLAQNTITINVADVMLRVVGLLSAPDDKTRKAAEKYLTDIEKGKLGVVGENPFFEGIKIQSPPSNNGSYLTQFIELQQFLQGSFFNEIGLSSTINMKRESISTGEASLNEDALLPLVETMLVCRQNDTSQLNEIFGTNITVDFDSSWLENVKERELALQAQENGVKVNGFGDIDTRDGKGSIPSIGDNNGNGSTSVISGNSNTRNDSESGSTEGLLKENNDNGNETLGNESESRETELADINGNDEGINDEANQSNFTNDSNKQNPSQLVNINITINEGGEVSEDISDSESDFSDNESDTDKEGNKTEKDDKSESGDISDDNETDKSE